MPISVLFIITLTQIVTVRYIYLLHLVVTPFTPIYHCDIIDGRALGRRW